jgi:hypothetical protein
MNAYITPDRLLLFQVTNRLYANALNAYKKQDSFLGGQHPLCNVEVGSGKEEVMEASDRLFLLIFLGFPCRRFFACKPDAWPQCGVVLPVNIKSGGYAGVALRVSYMARRSFVPRVLEHQQRFLCKVCVDPR